MYSVHQEGEDGPVGSIRSVYVTLDYDYSPEVRANGEIEKRFKILRRLGDDRVQSLGKLELCSVEESQHSTVLRRSVGLRFSEWVTYRPPASPALAAPADANDLPVRLIDIEATLDSSAHGGVCFIQPTDWSFHIISHTWSVAVRNFSISIGNKVTSAEDYNKAFQGARLNELPDEAGDCYHSLLAFFRMRKEEGVKITWFDALCINQTDREEKDREISRMGAYYGRSLGCYVLAHGIGRGFKLWDTECCPFPHAPRWFMRVWTFQEFLLPRKVTFLVEGLAKKTIGYVNHFIRQGGASGFCKCALPERAYTFRMHLKEIDGGEEDEITCSSDDEGKQTRPCDRCRCVQFIRKCAEQVGLYFVDREAYCFLCEVDIGPPEHIKALLRESATMLWNLFALANWPHIFKLVQMLRGRQCTNEEDRVLGVLGLLQRGKQGHVQLRSGKTLTEQILNLHHYCDLQTFFGLCMMEPLGFQTVGMSWAPCLQLENGYNPVELGELPASTGHFHPTARILNVSQQGLRLATNVASARLVPRGQSMRCIPLRGELRNLYHKEFRSKYELFVPPHGQHMFTDKQENYYCYSCFLHGINDNCTHWIRECELEVGEGYTYPLKAHAREGCGSATRPNCIKHRHIVIQDPWIGNSESDSMRDSSAQFVMRFVGFSIDALKPFPVWLVLLGETSACMMGMMCIPKSDINSELHKVGIFACPKHNFPRDRLFFRRVPYQGCLIGGFGGNAISRYVSQE